MLKSNVRLTVREQQVIALLTKGLSNKLIGAQLDLQEKTIKHHLTHVFRKLAVSNRTEAAIAWLDHSRDCSTERDVDSSVLTSGRSWQSSLAPGVAMRSLPLGQEE